MGYHCECGLLTRILAPITPTSLWLRKFVLKNGQGAREETKKCFTPLNYHIKSLPINRFTGIPGIHASQAITTYDWNPCRDFNDTNPGDKFDKNCFNVAVSIDCMHHTPRHKSDNVNPS